MKRPIGYKPEEIREVSAEVTECPFCGRHLWIAQHRDRHVQRLDAYVHLVRQDKQCKNEGCPGEHPLYRPVEDLRFALPGKTFGFDVVLEIGERHLRGDTLGEIWRDLNNRGVPIDRRHVGRLFRDFLALWKTTRDESALVSQMEEQGGAVLMADGVQFDGQAPVLYVAWDAVSGTPLFGERKEFRGKDDLVSIFQRVKAMHIPVRAVVTDKEKGLVPAVKEIFPDAPYQYCQTHFLSNCAKPLEPECSSVGASVTERASGVREVAKAIHEQELKEAKAAKEAQEAELSKGPEAEPPTAESWAETEQATTRTFEPTTAEVTEEAAEPVEVTKAGANESARCDQTETPSASESNTSSESKPTLDPTSVGSERDFAKRICELVRQNARVTGKAPLDPRELKQHQRLEKIRETVDECRSLAERGGAVPSER